MQLTLKGTLNESSRATMVDRLPWAGSEAPLLSTILLFSQGLGEFSVCLAFCCLNHLFSGMGGGALFVCKNVRIFDVSKNCKNGFRCL